MEKAILNKMEWNLTVPTMYVFLVRFAKAAGSGDKEVNIYSGFPPLSEIRYPLELISAVTLSSVRVDADAAYGVLLLRAGTDGVQHGDILPFVCRGFSSVRRSLHPQEKSSLDQYFEVPHWFRRAPA